MIIAVDSESKVVPAIPKRAAFLKSEGLWKIASLPGSVSWKAPPMAAALVLGKSSRLSGPCCRVWPPRGGTARSSDRKSTEGKSGVGRSRPIIAFTPEPPADSRLSAVPTENATEVSVQYDYLPKFGLLGQIMGSLALDRQLTKGFKGFLNDLDAASRQ